jgi:RNA polymerase sigma-70 factor (ECF subfamily)
VFIIPLTHDRAGCYNPFFARPARIAAAGNTAPAAASEPLNTSDSATGGRGAGDGAPDWPELLARVRAGEAAAAETLVRRVHPLVARIVQGHCPRGDDPADLMQDVFVKMFSRLEQFDGRAPFEHWAARVAHTTCLDALRRRRARPECRWSDLTAEEQAVLETVTGASAPANADAPGALVLLERLLAGLSPEDAWLLRQVEIEERPLAELCVERGWSGLAGRVRLFRARRRLAAAFRALEGSQA